METLWWCGGGRCEIQYNIGEVREVVKIVINQIIVDMGRIMEAIMGSFH